VIHACSEVAYLGLGTNLGDRERNIQVALEKLSHTDGIHVSNVSSVYQSAPVGYLDQPDFLNAVCQVTTRLGPSSLLRALLEIERDMGRVREIRNGPRVIDIDILVFGELELASEELTVPHPRMLERPFVLKPLHELAPDLIFGHRKRLRDLVREIDDGQTTIFSSESHHASVV
jgi:2-amino-4-hydroxy-6-hydroxymethyldihydropteridine diphosphokinase